MAGWPGGSGSGAGKAVTEITRGLGLTLASTFQGNAGPGEPGPWGVRTTGAIPP